MKKKSAVDKKVGRRAKNISAEMLKIRLTPEEKKKLFKLAKAGNITVSSLVRQKVLEVS